MGTFVTIFRNRYVRSCLNPKVVEHSGRFFERKYKSVCVNKQISLVAGTMKVLLTKKEIEVLLSFYHMDINRINIQTVKTSNVIE